MTEKMRPPEITIGTNIYYSADELSKYDPAYFYGCARTVRNIIKKKIIKQDNYVYATWNKKNNWVISIDQKKPATKASLLLSSKWVNENIPKMMHSSTESKELLYDYPEAPDIIILNNEEKFKDDENKIVDIETRGERTPNGIYFLASDVSKAFEMPNLLIIIKDNNGSYVKDEDYKTFVCNNLRNSLKNANKKQTYITYDGMIHILFASHSKKAKTFRKWATETLFTIQMGTKEQKEELVSNVIGIPAKSLREVLKKGSTTPCIYRFSLGLAKDLRKSMNLSNDISDNYIIIKYGYTDDLVRRTTEHIKTYEKIKNAKIELMEYVYIDPKFLSQAEVKIKDFFNDIEIPINYDSFTELVAINPKHEKMIKQQFKYLHVEFSGSIKELVEKIENLKNEHKIALMKKDAEINEERYLMDKKIESLKKEVEINAERHISELLKKDSEIYKKEIEICKKDLMNEKLKNELLEIKISNK